MVIYLLHSDSHASWDEVTAVILGDVMAAHLELQSAGCIVYTPTERSSTHSSFIPVHLEKKQDGHIALEDMLLSWLPTASINGVPVERSKGELGKERKYLKKDLWNEEKGINKVGK